MKRSSQLEIRHRGDAAPEAASPRHVGTAMSRGFRSRCPACGDAPLFRAFLKPFDACPACAEEMHHHRADDLPAYLVIAIVGHLMVGGWLGTAALTDLPGWVHIAIWAPLTAIAAVALLQPVKGAVIGLQWANRMHGFDHTHADPAEHPLKDF
ncbi:DUF983 domain-containing protein [Pararhizobium mangrovi]|uniref:DUF983 domain-containing protein n=1 Tax=Pararhizobium mangrovi TaxID=2590452 RepID=A0A506TVL3_9HYPH|nr:DUF983 domain-containing protein [Pararhizobium mangrovi]TPW26122.1 DUF983 domain-containing protein [Pararhizobium mangrovi]